MSISRRTLRWILIVCAVLTLSVWGWAFLHRRGTPKPKVVVPGFPAGIVIHHSATSPVMHGKRVDVSVIDAMHARRGFSAIGRDGKVYHIGYHYLILQDGTIQPGRPAYLHGQHTRGYNHMLGICLVGNFARWSNLGVCGPQTPPAAQLAAAERLTRELMAHYGLTAQQVYLHRDLVATACPGEGFPRQRFFAVVARPLPESAGDQRAGGPETQGSSGRRQMARGAHALLLRVLHLLF